MGRQRPGREPAAGIRTFGLAGLFGGLAALSMDTLGIGGWIGMFALLSLLVIARYLAEIRQSRAHGLTTEIALMLTFLLGSLALVESALLAAGSTIVVTLLLGLKARLQRALQQFGTAELSGALQLLFISVVQLPNLPNKGYGPWDVFNPHATWWMVVLIAGIGFAAYVAVRLLGASRGLLLTALWAAWCRLPP